ncbi:hypothetical protein GPL21_00270 [Bradyrhizobium pachyrhizi]|uniref:Uncharacterized protein n=1 Tax=Bradyrhizobium pachyrhizi TaxID=280333 RepID=A0A844S8X4_9BRAD|nr:hypothetical protein [Bradyrhizobium pachyrhizi]MVT63548.1 hypothetical protein [Bradyrhizobium pachyrhizi]
MNDDDIDVIVDLSGLLMVLLAQPDADTAIDGMHKVAQVIWQRARGVQDHFRKEARAKAASRASAAL